ncbi:MAG: type II toxin-antitoxin system VapC family toxin [Holophagales bacterium]|nr:type II toxin-antitoxin system VapC family toxin [Holophagales bacterium]MYF96811.1 type II toxin-antitoxin system VapC family toxin [Holophagales bacterium]
MTPEPEKNREKGFDCVAFQREQRDRISRKLIAMTAEEQMDYLRNAEIKDPVLRRIWERSPKAKLLPLSLRQENSEKQLLARAAEGAEQPPRQGSPSRDGMASKPEPRARRVYVDTSVFRGCESRMLRLTTLRLFEGFRDGEIRLVLSALVARELESASEAVKAVLGAVPPEHAEFLEPSADAGELADRYIDAGAVDPEMRPVALHIALATLAHVDVLASWDYKYLLNFRRGDEWNVVNRELGHPHLYVHEVPAVLGEWVRDPDNMSFECVAFQHAQREKLGKELQGMSSEETGAWMRDYRPTDPILRRFTERTRRRGANDPAIEPKVLAEQSEE